ncbi:MAG TPA: methionine gamma-lyase, partial [Hyphomonas sp.]|nr:methionine gamma-lyase [Hyphomonas sp.]
VYFETPANPNMRLVDIVAVSAVAKQAGALTVVDNTYASPLLTRPIELGADFVIHSATKYLGGHGDLVAGVVCGRADLIHDIRMIGVKDMTGSVMAPLTAMLVMRGLKTLQLRMARHCESGQTVAEWLERHPAVSEVYYPGLPSHPQHELACRQMSAFGGMIAFELKGGFEAGTAMMDQLRLIQRAVSLGDAESLIQHPASMTHSTYSQEERLEHGISDGLVRLSVGLEDLVDILADLENALPTNAL